MKKLFVSFIALLFGVAVSFAQDQPQHGPDMSKMTEQVIKDLGLNEQQAQQFKAIMELMKPKDGEERPSREAMEKKMKEIDSKIKAILTPEQYAKYKKMHKAPQRPDDGQDNGPDNGEN